MSAGLWKNYLLDFNRKQGGKLGEQAKEEPVKSGYRSKLRAYFHLWGVNVYADVCRFIYLFITMVAQNISH